MKTLFRTPQKMNRRIYNVKIRINSRWLRRDLIAEDTVQVLGGKSIGTFSAHQVFDVLIKNHCILLP